MSKDTPTPVAQAAFPAPAAPAPEPARQMRVAYRAGPPTVTFCGRLWEKSQPQSVTPAEWEAMRARRDFPHLDFHTA